MRALFAVTAAAPLMLIAACQNEAADEAELAGETMTMETETNADESSIDAVPLAGAALDGNYAMTGADGSSSRIALQSQDMSYEYTRPDGTISRGNYSYADDYRLMIEDYDGSPAYFSFDNSALYQLGNENAAPYDRITVRGEYKRDNTNAAQVGGPGATTSSVADKRQ